MTPNRPTARRARPEAVPRVVATALAVVAGAVLSLQAWVNGRFGHDIHDGTVAATLSDYGGLLVLLVCCPFLRSFRTGVRRLATAARRQTDRPIRTGRPGQPGQPGLAGSSPIRSGPARPLRPYTFLGGLVGGVVVLSQGVSTAALGTATYTVALVGGQTLSGLVVDHFGVGPSGVSKVTARRLFGAVLALAGIIVPLYRSLDTTSIWVAALPLLGGIGLSWQMAVNGRLNVEARGPWPSVTLNFLLAAVVLGTAFCVDLVRTGLPHRWPHAPLLYTGGLLGLVFVLMAVVLVRHIGVLVMGLAMIAGQTLGALGISIAVKGDAHGGAAPIVSSIVVLLAAVAASQARRTVRHASRDHTLAESRQQVPIESELSAP